ncbi:type I restriction-modification enzyme R subunit C-terminal domain-containing protein [Granulicoccus phenolivorans]|uniref:type I restriction-modification enzyme R subunit C-terminal domain-containing protein n=1 Tax=Granulicoccus phenolivorans TaxID=266854 RepID=UPI0004199305|nr:type I restriction-modification enzyme R subunit C-terminal domain-containing protein [Granulicoccus phenolivorans]
MDSFAAFLDGSKFSATQIRFITLIIDELTANGMMEPARLFESPYVDQGHADVIFPADFDIIVNILRDVNANARPQGAA